MRFCSRGERGDLFVAHMDPLDLPSCADRIRYSVERIAAHAVDPLDSRVYQHIYEQVSHSLCHMFPFANSLRGLAWCRKNLKQLSLQRLDPASRLICPWRGAFQRGCLPPERKTRGAFQLRVE